MPSHFGVMTVFYWLLVSLQPTRPSPTLSTINRHPTERKTVIESGKLTESKEFVEVGGPTESQELTEGGRLQETRSVYTESRSPTSDPPPGTQRLQPDKLVTLFTSKIPFPPSHDNLNKFFWWVWMMAGLVLITVLYMLYYCVKTTLLSVGCIETSGSWSSGREGSSEKPGWYGTNQDNYGTLQVNTSYSYVYDVAVSGRGRRN